MPFSLNKVMLIGNVGQDPETRVTANNLYITKFSLATSRSYKDKDNNWQNETTWHRITAFNLSDFYKDKVKKGAKLYIEGRISINEFTDKEGIKRYFTDIIAESLIPLDGRDSDQGGGFSSSRSYDNSQSDNPIDSGPAENPDDDLPF